MPETLMPTASAAALPLARSSETLPGASQAAAYCAAESALLDEALAVLGAAGFEPVAIPHPAKPNPSQAASEVNLCSQGNGEHGGAVPAVPLDLIYGHLSFKNTQGEGKEPVYAAKLTRYEDGSHRIKVSLINPHIEGVKGYGLGTPGPRRTTGELSDDDKRRSVSRTKQKLYDKLRQIQADRLLTLTVRENVCELEEFQGYVKRFFRALGRHLPAFRYVAVFEQQKRGAWHAHLGIRGFTDVRLLRGLWLSIVGKVGGNVDIARNRSSAAHRICAYLGKYISKNIEAVGLNKKRYWHSRGIPEPDTFRLYLHSRNLPDMLQEVASIAAHAGMEGGIWQNRDGTITIIDS